MAYGRDSEWGYGVKRCHSCGEYQRWPEDYHNSRSRCKDCVKQSRNNSGKPKPHKGAYQLVLRSRYTGELRKGTGEIPKGWEIVTKAPLGCLLGRKYWELEEMSVLDLEDDHGK